MSFTVWPTHLGAVNERGVEPLDDPDYSRGQIGWGLNEQGRLVGHASVDVPRGTWDWTHVIYAYTPTGPSFITAQKLSHPFRLPEGGVIRLLDITDGDVAVKCPEPIHD